MVFALAYLHLKLTDSKGKGQVKVIHALTETGRYSLNLHTICRKIIKEIASVIVTFADKIIFI